MLAGLGVAVEPESTARREPRVVWRPIVGDPLRRITSAVWPAQSPHPAVERFAEIAAATLDQTVPEPMAVPQVEAARPWSIVFAPYAAGTGS